MGKIRDLFGGVGVSVSHPGATNALALDAVQELAGELQRGLVFANLIETDQLYGHRKDARGFADALGEIDARLGGILERMREDDLLVVAADHGVDLAHRRHRPHARVRAAARAHRRDARAPARGARVSAAFATTARWRMSARPCCAG